MHAPRHGGKIGNQCIDESNQLDGRSFRCGGRANSRMSAIISWARFTWALISAVPGDVPDRSLRRNNCPAPMMASGLLIALPAATRHRRQLFRFEVS